MATGMGVGAVTESVKRMVSKPNAQGGSIWVNESNFERLANSLSRMRGAALKLGQMLSIQDDALLPAPLTALLERVRNSADIIPFRQVERVLVKELGADWRTHFSEFETQPIAAASIGQVHRAKVAQTGEQIAVKIQYPGVASSIESDLDNLSGLLSFSGMLPAGMYLDKTIQVTKQELLQETDYINEASNQIRLRHHFSDDDSILIPKVFSNLTTTRIICSEFVTGIPVDKLESFDQETRNFVSFKLMEITLRELFEFRFMQTDPNWTNFLWNPDSRKVTISY
uniref:ABC1 atypical kinase-like domain-containing protein n=1 Tax=Arcella intermedia TaxID=1963864 RepID=A0A6B2LBF6_9EUKA